MALGYNSVLITGSTPHELTQHGTCAIKLSKTPARNQTQELIESKNKVVKITRLYNCKNIPANSYSIPQQNCDRVI